MRYLLLAMTLLLTACQTNLSSSTPKQLVQRTMAFEDVVRWGALEKMVIFTKSHNGEYCVYRVSQ